jgi:type II secretory pathway pseudopilin PulG
MKGQASVEYIAILAVVIIIAVVIVSVLGGFSSSASGASVSQSQAYWQSADVALTNVYFSTSNGKATLRNNQAFAITLLNLSTLDGVLTNGTGCTGSMNPGDSQTCSLVVSSCTVGTVFSKKAFVRYYDTSTPTSIYNFTGSIALAGRCQ